jgi:hypothetical protein
VLTITTSFDPTAMSIPVTAGNLLAIWNTTSVPINIQNTADGTPYTVATVSNSQIVTSPVAITGASDGTYTYNNTCGSNGVTYGQINGTDNCVRVSLLAHTANPAWNSILSVIGYGSSSDGAFACVGSPGNTTGNYEQVCYHNTGGTNRNSVLLYECQNHAGCSVSGDWSGTINNADSNW